MRLRLMFEPRDLWIGVFWQVKERLIDSRSFQRKAAPTVELYICLLPMLPLKVSFTSPCWKPKQVHSRLLEDERQ